MKIRHEVCIDCNSDTVSPTSQTFGDQVLVALGHGPALCFRADLPTDIVHGSVTIVYCDTRILGQDVLVFRDGHRELSTATNIDTWLKEQGHKLVKIVGDKAFGNTIIDVEIYEQDAEPGLRQVNGRLEEGSSKIRRPLIFPTELAIRNKLVPLSIV